MLALELLDEEDRHWRARQQAPTSLALLCAVYHEDPEEAPRLVELIFELLFVASRIERHNEDYYFFLGTEMAEAMLDTRWPETAQQRVKELLPRLRSIQYRGGHGFAESATTILTWLLRGGDKGWLCDVASKHGAPPARRAALRALAIGRSAELAELFETRAREDPDSTVRCQASRCLDYAQSQRGATIQRLPNTISRPGPIDDQRRDKLVRSLRGELSPPDPRTAAQKLSRATLNSPARAALINALRTHEKYDVRLSAARTLGRQYAGDDEIRDLLIERSADDFEWYEDEVEPYDMGRGVRATALMELARGWADDEGVHRWVLARCKEDPSRFARADAPDALVFGWPAERSTLDCLMQATDAETSVEMHRALQILARAWPEHPEVRRCLRIAAQRTDIFPGLVATALEALYSYADPAAGDTEMPSQLHTLAREHEQAPLRGWAAEQLVTLEPEDPATLALVLERSVQDDEPNTRDRLLRLAATTWPMEPQVHKRLREAAKSDAVDWLRDGASRLLKEILPPAEARRLD